MMPRSGPVTEWEPPPDAVGSVVVVLPDDGRTYVVAPDGNHAEGEQVRFFGRYRGDLADLGMPE